MLHQKPLKGKIVALRYAHWDDSSKALTEEITPRLQALGATVEDVNTDRYDNYLGSLELAEVKENGRHTGRYAGVPKADILVCFDRKDASHRTEKGFADMQAITVTDEVIPNSKQVGRCIKKEDLTADRLVHEIRDVLANVGKYGHDSSISN